MRPASMKRGRMGRSSSSIKWAVDMQSELPPPPINSASNPKKIQRKSVAENAAADQSRSKVLTLPYPVQPGTAHAHEERGGGFLEKCHYCKKKLLQNSDLFADGSLRAFCTAECRDSQTNLEKVAADQAVASGETMGQRLHGINE